MADILHRISINASPESVRELIATKEGIEQWWTGVPVGGDASVGGNLLMYFGGPDPAAVMELVEDRPERIVWRCVDGPPDWLNTDIVFELKPTNGGTTLLFTHADWREQNEFMANCSSEWGSYLIGIKRGLEGGAFTPFPAGQVSRWG